MSDNAHPTKSPGLRFRLLLIVGLLASSIGCDQATKRVAVDTLRGGPAISMIGGIVRLQYAENEGAFLSLGSRLPASLRFWMFVVGVAVMVGAALLAALAKQGLSVADIASLSLIAGGGLSNWVDRLQGGRVVDFMNLGVGPVRTGIFNVADLAIVAGVVLLALKRRSSTAAMDPPRKVET
jgi:signal peptidase II